MDNDTLEGLHGCDMKMPTKDWVEMRFFRPSHDLSILYCSSCGLHIEFEGLPQRDFAKQFNEIEQFLVRRIRLLWDNQPSVWDSAMIGRIHVRVLEGFLGERLQAWCCPSQSDISFSGLNFVRMEMKVVNETRVALHCPLCGYTVRFKWELQMNIRDIHESLQHAIKLQKKKKTK
jgi:hypothetical protein